MDLRQKNNWKISSLLALVLVSLFLPSLQTLLHSFEHSHETEEVQKTTPHQNNLHALEEHACFLCDMTLRSDVRFIPSKKTYKKNTLFIANERLSKNTLYYKTKTISFAPKADPPKHV